MIGVRDVVLVHDDRPWWLAIVEDLMYGRNGLLQAANIRTSIK